MNKNLAALGFALLAGLPILALLPWAMSLPTASVMAHDRGEDAPKCARVHNSFEAFHYFLHKMDYRAAGHTFIPKPLPEYDIDAPQSEASWLAQHGIDPAKWRNAKHFLHVTIAYYDAGLDQYVGVTDEYQNILSADRYRGQHLNLFLGYSQYQYLMSNIRACVELHAARPTATPTASPSPSPTATPES